MERDGAKCRSIDFVTVSIGYTCFFLWRLSRDDERVELARVGG